MAMRPYLVTITFVVSIYVLAAAVVHGQYMDDPIYVHPVFVGSVVWPFFLLMILALVNFSLVVAHVVKWNINTLKIYAGACLCAVLVCVAAASIDSATFIYAT